MLVEESILDQSAGGFPAKIKRLSERNNLETHGQPSIEHTRSSACEQQVGFPNFSPIRAIRRIDGV